MRRRDFGQNAGLPQRSSRRLLSVIRYEHPLNERIRTLMRLEDLYRRAQFFAAQTDARRSSRRAGGLFEITDVAARADLKTDLLQELERQKQLLSPLRSNPAIETRVLDAAARRHRPGERGAARADGQSRRAPARQRMADDDQAAHRDSRRRLRVRSARIPLLAQRGSARAAERPARHGSRRSCRSTTGSRSSCACCATTAGRAARWRRAASSSSC